MKCGENTIMEFRDYDLSVECDDPYGSRPVWAFYRQQGIPVYKATELILQNHPFKADVYRLVPPTAQNKVTVMKKGRASSLGQVRP